MNKDTDAEFKSKDQPPLVLSSVEEDLRILDRILDDIDKIDRENYVDTMIDCNVHHNNNNNNTSRKKNNHQNEAGKGEEAQKLVDKKLTTEQVITFVAGNLLLFTSVAIGFAYETGQQFGIQGPFDFVYTVCR